MSSSMKSSTNYAITTSGYKTRSTEANSKKIWRIESHFRELLAIQNSSYKIATQLLMFHKIYILSNANLGVIIEQGLLSQSIYNAAMRNRITIKSKHNDNKRGQYACKQMEKYCAHYENMCLSENGIITVDVFRIIMSFISYQR